MTFGLINFDPRSRKSTGALGLNC